MKKIIPIFLIAFSLLSCENRDAAKYYEAANSKADKIRPGDSTVSAAVRTANLKEVLQDLDKAIASDPNYVKAYLKRAYINRALGDNQGGLADAERVVELDPKNAGGYAFTAETKSMLDDHAGAIIAWSKTIEIYPKKGFLYCYRAMQKEFSGDSSGALKDYDEALALAGNDLERKHFYYHRGRLKLRMNDKTGCADLAKSAELGYELARKVLADSCK